MPYSIIFSKEQTNNKKGLYIMDNLDFEDFEDLDTYLNSETFKKVYNNVSYQPTGKSWAGNHLDYTGMTIEDFGR